MTFRTYLRSTMLMDVSGSNLDLAARKMDYRITVGEQQSCEVIDLLTNTIFCELSADEPPLSRNTSRGGAHRVSLSVGNRNFFVGYIQYFHRFTDDPMLLALVISLPIVFVLVVVFIVVCVKFRIWKRVRPRRRLTYRIQGILSRVAHKSVAELLQVEVRLKNMGCLIQPASRMTLKEVIGEGNFGKVYKGTCLDLETKKKVVCAIKTLKGK